MSDSLLAQCLVMREPPTARSERLRAGEVKNRIRASGLEAYFRYDALGRVIAETRHPSGDTVYHEYDAVGRVTRALKTGVAEETWAYDAAGRTTRHSQGSDFHLYHAYDAAGNRTWLGLKAPGMTYYTCYEYDARNLLSALTDPWGETVYYTRDGRGLETVKRMPNGVTTYHVYDAAGQVTGLLHRGPSGLLQGLYYTYDADGQRTRIEREDGTRIYYSYDGAHRLTGEDWLSPANTHLYAFAYEYDAAGNRTKKSFNGEVTYYDYNTLNQLAWEAVLGDGATYYTWTADGEMATKHDATGWTYFTWDVDESLQLIEAPEVTLANTYNARMQRVSRDEDGTASTLIHDAQKLLAEDSEAGAIGRLYLSEGGSVYSPLVAQFGSEHWFLFDALGSTSGLTSDAGALSDTFRYEAFGNSLGRTGATATPYQYVGGASFYSEASVGAISSWLGWCAEGGPSWYAKPVIIGTFMPGLPLMDYLMPRGWHFEDQIGLLPQLPAAWIEVGKTGYFNCMAHCKIPFSNTNPMKGWIDAVTEPPPDGFPPPDMWGDLIDRIPDFSLGIIEWLYRRRYAHIMDRLPTLWGPILRPGWEGIIPYLKTIAGAAKSWAELAGALGLILDIVETVYCVSKCHCLLRGK